LLLYPYCDSGGDDDQPVLSSNQRQPDTAMKWKGEQLGQFWSLPEDALAVPDVSEYNIIF
jgi:hypothetical protein